MFSFTWLFRLWSKNHSNFNRLWISPTFFYCRKRFAIDFRQLAFRHPKRNAADCLIRELLENGMDAAKHQHHSSLSSLQTDKLSRVCLFLSNPVCEDLYSELCLFYPASGFSEKSQNFLWFIQANWFTHHECWNESCVWNIWSVTEIVVLKLPKKCWQSSFTTPFSCIIFAKNTHIYIDMCSM